MLGPLSSILVVVFIRGALFIKVLQINYTKEEGKNILRTITPESRVWEKKANRNMAVIGIPALISRKSCCQALTIDLIQI